MPARIHAYIREHAPLIETSLERHLPQSRVQSAARLNQAIRYAAMTGGKRVRPVLTLLAAQLCGGAREQVLPVACGVEFVHAASLAADDLPAFDNALIRRGRPSVHAAFGQDLATLATLALLNQAYALFADVEGLVAEAARAIGCEGMIGGQAADLAGAPHYDRVSKTAALVRLAVTAGAMASAAGPAETGQRLDLTPAVGGGEHLLTFTPLQPWCAGNYRLVVDTRLEDMCGNRVGRPFEVDLFGPITREIRIETVALPFTIR